MAAVIMLFVVDIVGLGFIIILAVVFSWLSL
jgi:hypothetical protein